MNINAQSKTHNERGATLIELLIGMTLGLFVIAVLLEIYIGTKDIYVLQQGMANIRENAQMGIRILREELRSAGFIGCGRLDNTFPLSISPTLNQLSFTPSNMIQGYRSTNNAWDPPLPTKLQNKSIPDSDVISIKQLSLESGALLSSMTNPQTMSMTFLPHFRSNDILMITDCEKGDIFQVERSSFQGQQRRQYIRSTRPLQALYPSHAMIGRFVKHHFFVGDTGRENNKGDPIYGLFMLDEENRTQELVPGIEKIKIYYGEITNEEEGIIRYLPANRVGDWRQVKSIKIILLVNSVDSVSAKPTTFNFDGQTMQHDDGQLHQVWESYVAVRSKKS